MKRVGDLGTTYGKGDVDMPVDFRSLKELVYANRSCRRFKQNEVVSRQTLTDLVDLGRMSASGNNLQPLKYMLVHEPEVAGRVFPTLRWAAWLKDWPGPGEGERPAAYVVILDDKRVKRSVGVDHAIAAQSILLGARTLGLAGCMIASIDRDVLRQVLDIPEGAFDIPLVVALGRPAETIVVETVPADGNIAYWHDEAGVHHVPKRTLEDIIVR